MTANTFGHFLTTIPASQEYLTLNFAPASAPQRQQRWKNYGLSADFLGEYFSTFFPGDGMPNSAINRKDTVKATISYIANELLENAVKYSDASASQPISITLHLYNQEIIFQITNHAAQAVAKHYQEFVQEILYSEIAEVYTQQLEKTALGEGGSTMGILTIMNDYGATCGWAFETLDSNPALCRISVMVHLTI
jgi:hypothetical protein